MLSASDQRFTGPSAAALAFWLFVAADVMYFAGVFATVTVIRAAYWSDFAAHVGPAYVSCRLLLAATLGAHALAAVVATALTMARRHALTAPLVAWWLLLLTAGAVALLTLRA